MGRCYTKGRAVSNPEFFVLSAAGAARFEKQPPRASTRLPGYRTIHFKVMEVFCSALRQNADYFEF